MVAIIKTVTLTMIFDSMMLFSGSGCAKEFTLQVGKDAQVIRIIEPNNQPLKPTNYIYGFWVNSADKCSASLENKPKSFYQFKQPPQPGDYLCLIHTHNELGRNWKNYKVTVLVLSDSRGTKDEPPVIPDPIPKPSKVVQKCFFSVDKTKICLVQFK
jgi:hypothetical protein